MAAPVRAPHPPAAFLRFLSAALLLILATAISSSDIAEAGQRAHGVGLINCAVACALARRRGDSGRSCSRSAFKLGGDARLVLRGGGLDYSKSLHKPETHFPNHPKLTFPIPNP